MSRPWQLDGLCVNRPEDEMFPVYAAAQHEAAAACKTCPVIRQCLAHALDNREEYGVWGGRTERERRALLKKHPGIRSWARVLVERSA